MCCGEGGAHKLRVVWAGCKVMSEQRGGTYKLTLEGAELLLPHVARTLVLPTDDLRSLLSNYGECPWW